MRRLSLVALLFLPAISPAAPPNVLLVITDDQGFGDLGAHGNPVVKTPALDAFAKQSAWLKNFQVCPVCSPTRSSLLTGQYNYRTGVVDTFIGRSLMRPNVTTLAEHLAGAGYRTGLFGKWHLGDNYPLRPEDRGFQETLWSAGGGIAQPSDPPGVEWKGAYFDPVLKRNGKEMKTKGYCTDVFTDHAVSFMKTDSKLPFFCYVAFNAPHGPYQVPDELAAPYRKRDLTADGFPKIGQPWAGPKLNTEEIARAYGMIENIDTNFARMMKALSDKGVADNTIVIFLTDNGPGGVRWNAGLRNRKGTVYDGGIRVPCYVRWPKEVKPITLDIPLAHIDIVPTLLEASGVKGEAIDGRSFLRMLTGGPRNWPGRTLFVQWHRGDVPEKFRSFAARGPQYKLVQANGGSFGAAAWKPKFELFDMLTDPFEEKDLAADKPNEVAQLKREYETWFDDVTKKGFDPPRIIVGNAKENPVRLSRQDWRGSTGWAAADEGHWEIHVERAGHYKLTMRSKTEADKYEFSVGTSHGSAEWPKGRTVYDREVQLGKGDARVSGRVFVAGKPRGFDYVELEFLRPLK
jgi:arylsulfatase A-like enzyme